MNFNTLPLPKSHINFPCQKSHVKFTHMVFYIHFSPKCMWFVYSSYVNFFFYFLKFFFILDVNILHVVQLFSSESSAQGFHPHTLDMCFNPYLGVCTWSLITASSDSFYTPILLRSYTPLRQMSANEAEKADKSSVPLTEKLIIIMQPLTQVTPLDKQRCAFVVLTRAGQFDYFLNVLQFLSIFLLCVCVSARKMWCSPWRSAWTHWILIVLLCEGRVRVRVRLSTGRS